MSTDPHARLGDLRQQVRAQLALLSEANSRRQFHAELSPMAWHVGHSFFTEAYWVQEVVCAYAEHTQRWHPLYFPEYSHKEQRGMQLPDNAALIAWTEEIEAQTQSYWRRAETSNHELMQGDYLAWFLVQHYAQHLETMAMVRQQAMLTLEPEPPHTAAVITLAPSAGFTPIKGGEIQIGGRDRINSYDNELPAFTTEVADFALAPRPVSNGQWLAFMQDGGYTRSELWQPAGQVWLKNTQVIAPQHWRVYTDDGWCCPDPHENLRSNEPVHGICWHEAQAFAHWANARLPHEYEWEYARRTNALTHHGTVWEWCDNALHPYPGFSAFPYAGYSTPWFDGHHRIARGSSRFTQPEIRRPSFRNFYPESHRHIFAGLRLAAKN